MKEFARIMVRKASNRTKSWFLAFKRRKSWFYEDRQIQKIKVVFCEHIRGHHNGTQDEARGTRSRSISKNQLWVWFPKSSPVKREPNWDAFDSFLCGFSFLEVRFEVDATELTGRNIRSNSRNRRALRSRSRSSTGITIRVCVAGFWIHVISVAPKPQRYKVVSRKKCDNRSSSCAGGGEALELHRLPSSHARYHASSGL